VVVVVRVVAVVLETVVEDSVTVVVVIDVVVMVVVVLVLHELHVTGQLSWTTADAAATLHKLAKFAHSGSSGTPWHFGTVLATAVVMAAVGMVAVVVVAVVMVVCVGAVAAVVICGCGAVVSTAIAEQPKVSVVAAHALYGTRLPSLNLYVLLVPNTLLSASFVHAPTV
jgi:hypothetical protein